MDERLKLLRSLVLLGQAVEKADRGEFKNVKEIDLWLRSRGYYEKDFCEGD